ncbi:MAG: hypothetical protein Q9168_005889, partial [Polycauliona sp. 1 TL-2023]
LQSLIFTMGNPNRRVAPKPVPKPETITEQPAVFPPKPVRCTEDCGVLNWHAVTATWTDITDKDLPVIVKLKQANLKEAISNRHFGAAGKIRQWLDRFYSFHGPFEGSAPLDQLPQIPERLRKCRDVACPVKNHHYAKTYNAESHDCPTIVKINMDSLTRATAKGEYEGTVASHDFLNAFWSVHGGGDAATVIQ